jgi:chitin synthase
MEDKEFNLKGIHTANVILNYFYLGLLIMCFILSLGNRPQGSKWGYTGAMIGFAFITIYMTVSNGCRLGYVWDADDDYLQVAAFLLAFKGLGNLAKAQTLTFASIFTNHIFRNIVVSLVATLGLYIIASIIFVCGFSSLPV